MSSIINNNSNSIKAIENWIRYKADSGHFYYYNIQTEKSQWEVPAEFKENSTSSAQIGVVQNNHNNINNKSLNKPRDKMKPHSKGILTDEERVQMFKSLLADHQIKSDSEWPGILSDIIKDKRYSAIKTLKKRKQIFFEYKTEMAKHERQQSQQLYRAQKNAFFSMLIEDETVDLSSSFKEIQERFSSDSRFTDLHPSDRQKFFHRFLRELEEETKEREEKLYQENAPKFMEILVKNRAKILSNKNSDIEKNGKRKRSFKRLFEDVIEDFVSFECVKNLKSRERREVFEKFLREERRKKRKDSDNYNNYNYNNNIINYINDENELLLNKIFESLCFEENLFHAKTNWEEIRDLEVIKTKCAAFLNSRSREKQKLPRRVFDKFCCALEDLLRKDKEKVKKFLRSKKVRVRASDRVEELEKLFLDFPRLIDNNGNNDENINNNNEKKKKKNVLGIREEYLRVLLREMIGKAKFLRRER